MTNTLSEADFLIRLEYDMVSQPQATTNVGPSFSIVSRATVTIFLTSASRTADNPTDPPFGTRYDFLPCITGANLVLRKNCLSTWSINLCMEMGRKCSHSLIPPLGLVTR
uniref:Uncharacterized protein n=1 Tax=Arundo donax TaxID=35708 RepID=A0A0A9G7W2_ARUDO